MSTYVDISPAENLCKRMEGLSLVVYLDPVKVPTIGYGSTYYADGTRVKMGDPPITEQQAFELLRHELIYTYLPPVVRLCPILLAIAIMEEDIWKLNAILDFCYNLGAGNLQASTLRKRINSQDWKGAYTEILKWKYAGGVVLRGLETRRQIEADWLVKLSSIKRTT